MPKGRPRTTTTYLESYIRAMNKKLKPPKLKGTGVGVKGSLKMRKPRSG
jgi:hypothetical protein